MFLLLRCRRRASNNNNTTSPPTDVLHHLNPTPPLLLREPVIVHRNRTKIFSGVTKEYFNNEKKNNENQGKMVEAIGHKLVSLKIKKP